MEHLARMPRYRSIKHVWALKIKHVTLQPGTMAPKAHVFFEDESVPPIHVDLYGKPTPHAGWYYIVYDPVGDNPPYESFSPPEAFEKGYTKLA